MGGSLVVGQRVSREVVLERELVDSFASMVQDQAPVHSSPTHASALGFGRPIVHGFLLGSLFSGLLGERLPGPKSVIAKLELKFVRPVFVGDSVRVSIEVVALSPATGSVSLNLCLDYGDQVAVHGRAVCVFPGDPG